MSIIEYKINSNEMKLMKVLVALRSSYHLSEIDIRNASIFKDYCNVRWRRGWL